MPLQSMAGGEAIQPCLTSSPFMVSSSSLPARTPVHGQQRPNLPGYIGDTDGFIAKATQYTDITELTPELLRLFI